MRNNVPNLRFNGFCDEWKSVGINSLFSEVRNGFVGTATPYYVEKGVPYLQSNNIRKNKIDLTKLVHITEEFHNKNKKSILKIGDILMVQSGHAGECAVVPKEFENTNCHALIVMTPNSGVNSLYCSYYINSDIGQNRLFKLITGNTIKHILASEIKEFRIMIPKSEEQKKIAKFLTKVDKVIEKQEEKVRNLESYKKGMMQKLFSQEIRFKGKNEREYPKWEKKNLGNIVTKKMKGGLPEYCDGNGNTLLNNEYLENVNVEPTYVTNDNNVNKEDVLILWDGSQAGKVYTGVIGVLGSTFVSIKLDDKNSNLFIYQILNYQKDFIQNAWREGSGVPHVAKDFIENFNVVVPCLEEQTKIANLLSNIDLILEKEKEKLAELRLWKKGLLQQMFV